MTLPTFRRPRVAQGSLRLTGIGAALTRASAVVTKSVVNSFMAGKSEFFARERKRKEVGSESSQVARSSEEWSRGRVRLACLPGSVRGYRYL